MIPGRRPFLSTPKYSWSRYKCSCCFAFTLLVVCLSRYLRSCPFFLKRVSHALTCVLSILSHSICLSLTLYAWRGECFAPRSLPLNGARFPLHDAVVSGKEQGRLSIPCSWLGTAVFFERKFHRKLFLMNLTNGDCLSALALYLTLVTTLSTQASPFLEFYAKNTYSSFFKFR